MGVDYGYSHPWFSVAGETAYSTEKGGVATLNRVSWKISPRYTLSGSHRYYSYQYYSFYASALSENSNVQNESGATLRLDASPVGRLSVVAYADFFYNPWPRYSLTHASSGQEGSISVEYEIDKRNKIGVRYQLKNKERSDRMELHNRLRLQYTRLQGEKLRLQTMLNMHVLDRSHIGWAMSQYLRYVSSQWRLSSMLSYFNTPDYQTRVFVFEPLLTNQFRYPSLYGRGLRFVTTGMYQVWKKRLSIEVLYSVTRYTDRKEQGSGMQQIRSPWKQDVSLQLRLKI